MYDLINQKKIYESKPYNSCVFVGYDESGKAKYAAVRSSNPKLSYRQDCTGSDKSYAISVVFRDGKVIKEKNLNIQKLYVFESPIDLISYLSLLKQYHVKEGPILCISLGGVSDLALKRTLAENPNMNQIVLCLDNDGAGTAACEQMAQSYGDKYKLIRCLPQCKDFNEDLVALINEAGSPQASVQNEEDEASYEIY